MVMFGEEQEKEERVAAIRLAHLQEQLEECMHLQRNLSLANQQLAVDQRYIQKVSVCASRRGGFGCCLSPVPLVMSSRASKGLELMTTLWPRII